MECTREKNVKFSDMAAAYYLKTKLHVYTCTQMVQVNTHCSYIRYIHVCTWHVQGHTIRLEDG